jgi:hypothetical protein
VPLPREKTQPRDAHQRGTRATGGVVPESIPLPAAQVVLFLLASHGTDFGRQPLGLNLLVLLVLVIAKLPALHKVRILGINKY